MAKSDFYSRYISVAGIDKVRRDIAVRREALAAEIRALEAQDEILAKLRPQDTASRPNGRQNDHAGTKRVAPSKAKPEPKSSSPRPKQAAAEGPSVNEIIMSFMAVNPRPHSHSAIVDHVLANKSTTAKDPRSMVFSYISALKRGQYLAVDEENNVILGKRPWSSHGSVPR